MLCYEANGSHKNIVRNGGGRAVLEKLLFRVTQGLVYAALLIGFAAWATMPWMLDTYILWFMRFRVIGSAYRTGLLLFVMTTGAGALWIVAEMTLMLRTLDTDPFVLRNVHALYRAGGAALFISLAFFVRCLRYISPLALAVAAMLLMLGLCALVMAAMFRRAVEYKKENDLTI